MQQLERRHAGMETKCRDEVNNVVQPQRVGVDLALFSVDGAVFYFFI